MTTDILIIGSGPIGIACGIEATRRGVSHLILDKGCLLDAIHRYPPQLVFFSTPELLEIADVPFVTAGGKPTRSEVIHYYRRLTEHFRLEVRLYEAAERIERDPGRGFRVRTSRGIEHEALSVVIATGFYDHPNLMGVEGENLPKVSHYYLDPHPFWRRKVAVIGAQNSAVEAALELWRNGAEVTLVHRGEGLGSGVKYWVRPDIENRIQEGSIRALFGVDVERILESSVVLRRGDGSRLEIENDFVFALTGYHPDREFLESAGVRIDPASLRPVLDPATMETNVPGLYVAGVAAGGRDANRIFIENSRIHAKLILEDVASKLARHGPA